MTLHRWAEEECNGTIQRDGENGDGKPRRYYQTRMGRIIRGEIIPDRERGALKRLEAIVSPTTGCYAYHQPDPRGASLYIVPPWELAGGEDIRAVYSRGIAVY
jgi:hypothetical protein